MNKKELLCKLLGIILLSVVVSVCTPKKSEREKTLEARIAELESVAVAETPDYLFKQNFAQNNITEIVTDDGWGNSYEYLPNIGFSAGKRVIYNGAVSLLNYSIPNSALAVLNKEELRLLRNTVYAKHGMIFQSNDLTKHFRQFDWYNPKNGNVDALLTDVDKANIGNIQIFENAKQNLKVSKRDLARSSTYIGSFPASSWTPELEINNDNTIRESGSGEDNWKGTYRVENGFLVVLVTEQSVSDSYLKLVDWQWPDGVTFTVITYDGVNSGNIKITYRTPIQMIFPVSDEIYLSGEYSDVSYRLIGSDHWF